jgi:hypothetical protein
VLAVLSSSLATSRCVMAYRRWRVEQDQLASTVVPHIATDRAIHHDQAWTAFFMNWEGCWRAASPSLTACFPTWSCPFLRATILYKLHMPGCAFSKVDSTCGNCL